MAQQPDSDADYYGMFMTGLFGLVDDAELSGYEPKGVVHLRLARDLFWAEFQRRHPGAWEHGQPASPGTS
jgi:hypothetical protein